MSSFPMIPASAEAKHIEVMTERFSEALPDMALADPTIYPPYAQSLLQFLSDRLDVILKGSPEDLVDLAGQVARRFPTFHAQAQRKPSSKAWKDHPKDAAAIKLVEACFDYDRFAKKETSWSAYSLIEAIGRRVCPYCQLHHINYHMPTSKKAFSLRPPLDHFLPRSAYPYLAVSLGNLMPCCSQCNSGVKLAIDPSKFGIPHPSSRSPSSRIKFSAKGSVPERLGGTYSDVKLGLLAPDSAMRAHVDLFKLKERYGWYTREVFDLMKNYNKFQDYPVVVRNLVWRAEFVLGFSPNDAKDRALGLCLLDVFNELESGEVA